MKKKILILVKTYPQSSEKYKETVCTAGIDIEYGTWYRIYPIPFRFLEKVQQYKKYDIIEADLDKNNSDDRLESHKVQYQNINVVKHLDTKNNWFERKEYINKAKIYDSKDEIIKEAFNDGTSLCIFRPKKIVKFICEKNKDVEKQKEKRRKVAAKIRKEGDLFKSKEDIEEKAKMIEKMPVLDYVFKYEFLDKNNKKSTLKIEDWEINQLYLNVRKNKGEKETIADLKKKYEGFIKNNEILLFLGTTKKCHRRRFTNPFIIVGIFYPKKENLRLF